MADGLSTLLPGTKGHTTDYQENTLIETTEITSEDKDLETSEFDDNRNESNTQQKSESMEAKMHKRMKKKEMEDREFLMYGAKHAMMVFVPVSLCMAIVVVSMNSLMYYKSTNIYLVYTPFHEDTSDVEYKLLHSAGNAAILLILVATMTFVLLLLYKFRFYKVIHVWLVGSSFMLLFIFSYVYLEQLLMTYNIPLDNITAAIFMWNFGMGGMFCIHWKGPLLLQQAYLIVISALVSLVFIKYLPEWTTWVVLGIMVFWDLVAVLCPKGPLKMLVETAEERQEAVFPALIYSSTMLWEVVQMAALEPAGQGKVDEPNSNEQSSSVDRETTKNDNKEDSKSDEKIISPIACAISTTKEKKVTITEASNSMVGREPNTDTRQVSVVRRSFGILLETPVDTEHLKKAKKRTKAKSKVSQSTSPIEDSNNDRGVKLGLGDFVFFGVLVGKASISGDWITTIACYIAVLIGLCCTLLLLAITQTALPALPFSLTFGLIFNFATSFIVKPFMDLLNSNQVYV